MPNARLSTSNKLSSLLLASSSTILAAQTSATGTTWVNFGTASCDVLRICNNTATMIEYRRDGAGLGMHIPAGQTVDVLAITNANQISFRRHDTSNTQVSFSAEAYVV
jgi:hypothetical protein